MNRPVGGKTHGCRKLPRAFRRLRGFRVDCGGRELSVKLEVLLGRRIWDLRFSGPKFSNETEDDQNIESRLVTWRNRSRGNRYLILVITINRNKTSSLIIYVPLTNGITDLVLNRQ